jgi:DNA-binding NarL/FixJ family response regulator
MDNASLNRQDKARILIVDAQRSVAEAFGYYLEKNARFAVSIASDALEARRKINASGGFELVLVDVTAPGLERADAVRHFDGLNGPGRTVIIAGDPTAPHQPPLCNAGDARRLYKSQPAAEIVDALSDILNSKIAADLH